MYSLTMIKYRATPRQCFQSVSFRCDPNSLNHFYTLLGTPVSTLLFFYMVFARCLLYFFSFFFLVNHVYVHNKHQKSNVKIVNGFPSLQILSKCTTDWCVRLQSVKVLPCYAPHFCPSKLGNNLIGRRKGTC